MPVYIKDRENRFTFANATMCERLGLPRSEIIGRATRELWSRDIADELQLNDERVFASGEAVVTEETILETDGLHTFLTSKYPILDDGGVIAAVGGMSVDITDRRRTESEAVEARGALEAALESMTDAVSITDATGRLTDFNSAFVTFHRFESRQDCVDSLDRFGALYGVFRPDGDPAPQDEWPVSRALRGERGANVEYGVQRRDTGETWVASYSFAPILGVAGEIVGSVSVGRDVTEQRLGEERLGQLESLIESQAALAQSREQFGMLAESMTDVLWTMDIDTMRFTYLTPSAERVLGYTPEEMKALSLEDLLTTDALKTVGTVLGEGLASAEKGDVVGLRVTEVDQRRKDGSIIATEVTTRFLPSADGRLHLVLGVTRDVTERKRAEESLRESQQRYETVIRTTLDGFLLTDTTGRLLEVNDAYCAMSGYSRQELLTMSVPDLEEQDADEIAFRMSAVMEGQPDRFESRHRRKDGSRFDVEVSIRFEPSQGGWFAGFVRDITEQKRADEQLRENAERNTTILRTAIDGFCLVDREGRLLEVNDAYCIMSGYSEQELLGMSINELVAADHAADIATHMRIVAVEGEDRFESRHLRKDGSAFDVEISVRARPSDSGQMAAFIRDVTQRKAYEARLEQSLSSIVGIVSEVAETRDPYTAGHQRRVSELATCIATDMGMSDEHVEEIRIAALLHDIGKLAVPAEILSKPGRLSDLEFELIKGHSEGGWRIISSANMAGPTAEIVYQHHERIDGTGYPRGLRGEDLLPAAKVLMVSDVVEAMVSHRPYRAGLGVDAALAEIERGAGTHYDTEVVAACMSCFRERGFSFPE